MGRPAIDLTGQVFGRLTVLERDYSKNNQQRKPVYWLCQCTCGNQKSIRRDKLVNGITQSCGCYSKEIRSKLFLIDLTGQQFGRLTVLERDMTKPIGKSCFAYWKCKCSCGNIVSVRGDHLRDNTTQSCGCLNSAGEEKITKILQENNVHYKTQYEFPNLKGDYNCLRFDFAILNLDNSIKCLIEYQGDQHYRKWGNESLERFEKRKEYDNMKRKYCLDNNIHLIEIPYTDFNKLDWEYIKNKMSEA